VKPLDRTQQLELVREAARAPSAHNTQPARWRFAPDGTVELREDVTRRLTVGDPTGRDAGAGLGAALEGLSLALSRRGLRLEGLSPGAEPGASLPLAARAHIVDGAIEDPLARLVHDRRSWRGRFTGSEPGDHQVLKATLERRGDAFVLLERSAIEEVAELNDRCLWSFMREPGYRAEFHRWMRFSRSDPRWARDGLTTECLALSPLEGGLAAVVLRPAVLGALGSLGLARSIVSERAVTRSAAAIVLFSRPHAEPPLETGRAFYRLWLELTAMGYRACPMSAVADSDEGAAHVRSRWPFPAAHRLVNVLRVGRPRGVPALSPRLPAEELLV
jgi:nitroreductase